MPCAKCEKKLSKLATPDVKEGSNRKININKTLEKISKKDKLDPRGAKCIKCKAVLHVNGKLCPTCAHKNGKCYLCGKTIFDTSRHRMTTI